MSSQRNLMYHAYMMQIEDSEKYTIFKSRDVSERLDSDVNHTTALIYKCIRAGLMAKVGREGVANLYMLTKRGVDRGVLYMMNFNPITQKLRTDEEKTNGR